MCKIEKKRLPNKFFLIEGIDGSGKDTFAKIFSNELKKYFYYDPNYTISIVGQPLSSCYKGDIARKFIEQLEFSCGESEMVDILTKNREYFYNKFSSHNGIFLCIRGLLTDIATLNIAFNNSKTYLLGQKIKIDKLIIIDIDSEIAYKRIISRGIPITWREHPIYLKFFRNFYKNFTSDCYKEKIIIKNTSLDILKSFARHFVRQLYKEADSSK